MRLVSLPLAGAGLLLLAACGGAEQPEAANAADAVNLGDAGVLEPANMADATDITPAEANAVDAAIDSALYEGNEAAANVQ